MAARKKATKKPAKKKPATKKKPPAKKVGKKPKKQAANKPTRNEKGQYVKGQSGNENGRPKGALGMTGRVRAVLESIDPSTGKPIADVLAIQLVKETLKNPAKMWQFLKEIIDRDEGRSDKLDVLNAKSASETAADIRADVAAMKETVPEFTE